MTHINPKITNAIQNAVNLFLNTDYDACRAIDSGGIVTYSYEASDENPDAPDIIVTLTVEAKEPANYYDQEGEIFDKNEISDEEFEEEANRTIDEISRHSPFCCGGCEKCRK